ncbi:MAG: transglycosylase SLT domain-containing protein [Bdellovibrionia bacterium]
MTKSLVSGVLVLILLNCSFVNAASPPIQSVVGLQLEEEGEEAKGAPHSIGFYESNLKKRFASVLAKKVRFAHEACRSKNWPQCIHLAQGLLKKSPFQDYGHWFLALTYLEQAEGALKKKNLSGARAFAQKAASQALQVQELPYSVFLKKTGIHLAQSELLLARADSASRSYSSSQLHYEKAFQRFLSENQLQEVDPSDLEAYAKLCKKSETPLCSAWVRKLYGFFSKQKKSLPEVEKNFASVMESVRSYRNPARSTFSYKAPDQDGVAFDAAMKLYGEEQFKSSFQAFEQFLSAYPKSPLRFRAQYWQAQALMKFQGLKQAQPLFRALQQETPLSYYGLLASQQSEKSIFSEISATLPLASDEDSALSAAEFFHLKRAELLLAQEALPLAAMELKEIKVRETLSHSFLVYLAMLAHQAHAHLLSFQVASELILRGAEGVFSSYGLQLIFPIDYQKTIFKYSDQNGLDPLLVMSLMKQESSFDSEAHSPAGARGLMQLMPFTAFEMDSSLKPEALFEAEDNIRVGTLYLSKLLTRFKGNAVYAVGAYNAGPHAMDRWIKASGSKKTMTEFIESIPYRETREYVSSILRNYFWYSHRIYGTSQVDFNLFWKVEEGVRSKSSGIQSALSKRIDSWKKGAAIRARRSLFAKNPEGEP